MKKLVLLLMAALALPVMAQMTATKAEMMRSQDRDKMEIFAPVKAFDASAITVAEKTRGGYLWDFESDESFEGWMSYDADGDGYGWEVENYYSYNGGTYSLTSRSYYGGILYPDNWLISPMVNLDGMLSIFTENYLSSYPDKIKVYVCVGEPDFDNIEECFVPISDFIQPGTEWEEHTFDLSEYAGAEGCFAIRHYDCYDEFRILVDYISLGFTPDPVATTPEELSVEPGTNDASVIWTDNDDSNWNLRYRVYTESTGYFWDFEDCVGALPEGFTTLDADGDGYDWMLWDPQSLGYDPGDGTALNGTKCAASASYQGVPLYPDNWLITPEVPLTGELSFYAGGQDPLYASEVFAVYVSVGDREWVKISEDITATSPIQKYTFDLSEYEGMTGQVAIRHYNVSDMFRLNIDDIMIGTPSEEAEWIYVDGLEDTEFVIDGLDPETTYEVQVQAYNEFNESDWTESCIFTTTKKTSIEEISADVKGDNRYYNMMGQQVDGNNLPAGIYIHNGKKILVK